ncbi:hypothetical protein [Enterococcus sp. AZ109]|uniref:hypothetical protein n=1 Tax=Enterococcus sp. AZ109 TaxID=2774634 RepID=UPI003F6823E4
MKRIEEEDHPKEVLKILEEKSAASHLVEKRQFAALLLRKIKNRSVERFGCVRLI